MERYFDAFFYFANWGSRILTLRLPRHLLDLDTVERYAVPDLIRVWGTDDHILIEFSGGEDGEDRRGHDRGRCGGKSGVHAW
jgi:hypothetical protein